MAFIRSDVLTPDELTGKIREAAQALGLSALGCAAVRRLEEGKALRTWLAKGYQADMHWMENPEIRENPSCLAPYAHSALVVGLNCYRKAAVPAPGAGRIANFAAGEDYHRVLKHRLKELAKFIFGVVGGPSRIAVDSAPLLERALARQAGLGWIGKNSCLISPRHGSWLLLGELLIPAELAHGCPHPNRCGNCRRCQDACPTGALVAPGEVDANRCIAYLTVEAKGPIPPALRAQMGSWMFGCDICQQACPWNRFAVAAQDPVGRLPLELAAAGFLEETEDSFRRRYQGTSLMRAGRSRMARNAAVVLGNSAFPGVVSSLRRGLEDPVSQVRGHAAWALGRHREGKTLRDFLGREKDPDVRAEIETALGSAGR